MLARSKVVSITRLADYPTSALVPAIDPVSWKIGTALQQGILLEVSTNNKPGLVCPNNNGSHDDMSLLTFMVGASAILPALVLCAQAGREHDGELTLLLPTIREIGEKYENELLAATQNVNTQRGVLFTAVVLAGAAGYLSQEDEVFRAGKLFKTVAAITAGLVSRELNPAALAQKRSLTNGEKLFLEHQIPGIRGEVECGLPSVRDHGLPALKAAFDLGASMESSFLHTLISLIRYTDDTNIISRGNLDTLKTMKNLAGRILDSGSIFKKEGIEYFIKMEKFCKEKGISPGGSADLLAITISIYYLTNGEYKVKII